MEENKRVVECLKRLAESLKDLPQKEDPPLISHWRNNPPESLTTAWQVLKQGGELVRSTSTKYTLVTKIDVEEGSKLAKDLLKGCEFVGTGALVIYDNSVGCSRSMRALVKQSSRAVIHSCLNLLQMFLDNTDVFQEGNNNNNSMTPAQKTGVIWDACDKLNKLPLNNRNAMRRDLLTWLVDCQETYEEFSELLQHSTEGGDGNIMSNGDECYTSKEEPVAQSSLLLVKCSRGSINIVLKACECVGSSLSPDNSNDSLLWIQNLHNAARCVGIGMTDLGTLLYPPLGDNLQEEVQRQSKSIVELHDLILDKSPPVDFPEDLLDTSRNIRAAAVKRANEALDGIKKMT